MRQKIIIVGGGAGGYFSAINAKENNPNLDITILEKSNTVLQKVKNSGGGRCNVTNACFELKELIKFYPRGEKELIGSFHQFMTKDTIKWFETHGVHLKVEIDNRVFPKKNTSDAIIQCFQNAAKKLGIKVLTNYEVNSFYFQNNKWIVKTKTNILEADKLVIASGSSKKIWNLCKNISHTIIEPVPSLFTFAIKDKRLKNLLGISVPMTTIKISKTKIQTSGALLITHWGMSGPAILKLSSFGARLLADKNYQFSIEVNWLSRTSNDVLEFLLTFKKNNLRKNVSLTSPFDKICKRLWKRFVIYSDIKQTQNWADISTIQLENLTKQLTNQKFNVTGKNIFKDEFVSAGGIDLKEINFKRFESKIHKNLFFVGEALNIDAITGGFNFQNAWTSGFICAKAIAEN